MINITLPDFDLEQKLIEDVKYTKIISGKSGIYFLYDDTDELMYIGKARNFTSRLNVHTSDDSVNNTYHIKHNFHKASFIFIESPLEMEIYETYAINVYKPKLNRAKVYTYESDYSNKDYYKEFPREEDKVLAEINERRMRESLRGFKI